MKDMSFLGTEKLSKLIWKFSLPCVLSLLLTSLYNIVDQIFIGNGIGTVGNSATGIIFPFTLIALAFAQLFGDGAATNMSTKLGQGKGENNHRIVGNALLSSLAVGIILMAILYIGGDKLLMSVGCTELTINLTHNYGFIIFAMIPVYAFEYTLVSIVRADGSPRYALLAMTAGALFNIAGDPIAIFVICRDMSDIAKIQGAAFATIGGQLISCILLLLYLRRTKTFKLGWSSFKFNLTDQKENIKLGLSSFLTQFWIIVLSFVNNTLFVKYGIEYGALHFADPNEGSVIALSSFVCVMKLFTIVLNIALGLIIGALPVIGYNYGAGKIDRVKGLFKRIIIVDLICSLIFTALFELLPGTFIGLFGGSNDPSYVEFACNYMRIYLMFMTCLFLQKICALFTQIVGKKPIAYMLAMLRDALVVLSVLVVPVLFCDVFHWTPDHITGMFWSAPIADVIALIITIFFMIPIYKNIKAPEWDKK